MYMADFLKEETLEEVKKVGAKFNKKLESDMHFKSDYFGELMSFDWVDEIEEACPFIDIIVRRPKLTLIQEENVTLIEKSKRINVSSVKNLAKHTEYINKVNADRSVEPKKILDIRNEETFNIYENRFLYTLIHDMVRFISDKEELLNNFQVCDDKLLEYVGKTETLNQKVNIELKVTTESLPNSDIDKKLKDEIKAIKHRIKRIKEYISSWQRSEMMKALDRAHVPLIVPPLKKTNIILKNPNFKIAVKLWEYIRTYDLDNKEDEKDNVDNNGNDVMKGFLDHAFLIDYFVLDSMSSSKREQKRKMSKYAVLLLTEEIKRIVSLLNSCGYKITDEELMRMIAKELKDEKSERLVGVDDVKKKFKNAMDEYLERMQEYL